MRNKESLYELWSAVRDMKGWLSTLGGVLEPQELEYLIDLEDRRSEVLRGMEKTHAARPKNQDRPEVDIQWGMDRRREFAAQKVADGTVLLQAIRLDRGRAAKSGDDFSLAFCGLLEKDALAEIRRFSAMVERQSAPADADTVTDAMIEQARTVPIQMILAGSSPRMTCPFHEDKHRSASISKGFFKCFHGACNKRLDAIAWMVEVNGFTFQDAVRKLIRRGPGQHQPIREPPLSRPRRGPCDLLGKTRLDDGRASPRMLRRLLGGPGNGHGPEGNTAGRRGQVSTRPIPARRPGLLLLPGTNGR